MGACDCNSRSLIVRSHHVNASDLHREHKSISFYAHHNRQGLDLRAVSLDFNFSRPSRYPLHGLVDIRGASLKITGVVGFFTVTSLCSSALLDI